MLRNNTTVEVANVTTTTDYNPETNSFPINFYLTCAVAVDRVTGHELCLSIKLG